MSRKFRFSAGCPIQNCKNSNTTINWVHATDNGDMYIFDDGHLECEDCGTSGLIIDWLFDCSAHDYQYASYQGFLNMISVLGHLEADEDFVDDCLEAGRKQRKKFKGK